MSWFGDRDHKTLICDYCTDECDADEVSWTWPDWINRDGLDFCSDACEAAYEREHSTSRTVAPRHER